MQWANLCVIAPCMIAVADPWDVKHVTVAAGIAAGVSDWVMVCMTVLHRHLKIQLPSARMKKKELHWHLA